MPTLLQVVAKTHAFKNNNPRILFFLDILQLRCSDKSFRFEVFPHLRKEQNYNNNNNNNNNNNSNNNNNNNNNNNKY